MSLNTSAPEQPSLSSRLPQLLAVAVLSLVLAVGAWIAGRQTGGARAQQLTANLNRLQDQLTSVSAALDEERGRRVRAERALSDLGNAAGLAGRLAQLRQRNQEQEAELSQYRSTAGQARERAEQAEVLWSVFALPGLRLCAFTSPGTATSAVAYALTQHQLRLVVFAANLPPLNRGHRYRLWLRRSEPPELVVAGTLEAANANHAVLEYSQVSNLAETVELIISDDTDGTEGGPAAPLLAASLKEE